MIHDHNREFSVVGNGTERILMIQGYKKCKISSAIEFFESFCGKYMLEKAIE